MMTADEGGVLAAGFDGVERRADGAGFRAMLESAGVARVERGWIRVTGEDRVRWLNGMVTNSIQALEPGAGCFNFVLSAQGRIQGTAWAWAEAEAVLLETDRAQVEGLMALLDRFIIMDDVVLEDVSAGWHGVEVFGLRAGELGLGLGLGAEAGRRVAGAWDGVEVAAIGLPAKVVPRMELWAQGEEEAERLWAAVVAAGAVEAGAREMEWLRVMEGTPRFGVDIRERELPQETGQGEALHFSKGCYLGQEIVERIRSRGAVHRGFRGFVVEGSVAVGAALEAGGKAVGEVTSVAEVPWAPGYPEGVRLALGYVRREAVEVGTGELAVAGGGTARVVTLPRAMRASAT